MTVGAVNSDGASEARSELERYQQKLAADLAAKAAARVIAADKEAVTKAQRAVQQSGGSAIRQNERGGGTAVDITV